MHPQPSHYYRSLEFLCRRQAALSSTAATQKELECMALEYRRMADWLEQQLTATGVAQERADRP
jgi:hypothetical protein